MHLTGSDLTVIASLYLGVIALIVWLARHPRLLKTSPRLYPLGMALCAAVVIALLGVAVMVAFDPAAAALLVRLLDD